MKPKVLEGQIILRQWGRSGLVETPKAFNTLDELYAHCLKATDPNMVDRIIIEGRDENGQKRVLAFAFQSITVTPKA